jgi:transcriptional regulator with XRE-family HTH domain
MEDAGEKLRKVRERLGLTIRHVEEASRKIASRHHNDEFVVGLSRLSEIENKGTLPSLFRLYSLCCIYRIDMDDVLEWYGVDMGEMAADSTAIEIARTHPIGFRTGSHGQVLLPLALDPGIDMRRTTFLSRMIQRWGKLPVALLNGLDLKDHRYAYVGTEDCLMYPLIQPGSLVLIDESRRKVVNSGWTNEFERPIYFVEHRGGFACAWCTLNDTQLVLQPHPASMCAAQVFLFPDEIDVLGQVTGVAMRLDPGKRRRGR